MAKDDYDVIVYRILIYFYACLKRKIIFDNDTFAEAVERHTESDAYLNDILRMMQQEGLIEGIKFKKMWGGDVMILSELQEAKITPVGIHYIKDNERMKSIGDMLRDAADTIAKLASILMIA